MLKWGLYLVLVFFGLALPFNTFSGGDDEVQIEIKFPQENAEVGLHEIIRGKTTDPTLQVYVLVHPMLTNLWWVQRLPAPTNTSGLWQTLSYFGTKEKGVSEFFEVVAIATRKKLTEGQVLQNIPINTPRSDLLTVIRTK